MIFKVSERNDGASGLISTHHILFKGNDNLLN